jgi:hypothetical protein
LINGIVCQILHKLLRSAPQYPVSGASIR